MITEPFRKITATIMKISATPTTKNHAPEAPSPMTNGNIASETVVTYKTCKRLCATCLFKGIMEIWPLYFNQSHTS